MRPALLVLCLAAAGGPAAKVPRITEIDIRTENVFSRTEAAAAFFPYELANAIHLKSRNSLIEKYLLFRVGDPLNPDQLAETERNLRATGLFRFVRVRSEGTKVIVETGDAWTLLLRGSLSNKGGVTTYSAGVEENNLLGTGRQLKFLYDKGTERISRSFTFADPAFLRPYTLFRVVFSDLSDGTVYEGRLQRPFYSLDTPWAAGLFYRQARFGPKIYAGGEEVAVWNQHETDFRAEGGLRADLTENTAHRVIGSVEWTDTTLGPGTLGAPPPPADLPRKFLFFGAGLQKDARRWIQRSDVETIGRVEDFNLAPVGSVELGISPEALGATGAARLIASGSMGTLLPSGFSVATLSGESRYENGFQNTILSVDARAYFQSTRWTFAMRIGAISGWRLDPETQFYLDGETGLRAYRLHAVSGAGHLVGNLELRTVFLYDVLRLVSIGAAVFADAGVSWGAPDGFWRLSDAGAGLRFGLTRASQTTLLRLDVARSFDRDPLGRRGWLVSFASSQAF
ncbi:MAG: hypothetical protein ACM3JH_04775 [Acidithiobacillales bacterium]